VPTFVHNYRIKGYKVNTVWGQLKTSHDPKLLNSSVYVTPSANNWFKLWNLVFFKELLLYITHAHVISLMHNLQTKILSRKHAHNKSKTVFHSTLSLYLVKPQCKVCLISWHWRNSHFFPHFITLKNRIHILLQVRANS